MLNNHTKSFIIAGIIFVVALVGNGIGIINNYLVDNARKNITTKVKHVKKVREKYFNKYGSYDKQYYCNDVGFLMEAKLFLGEHYHNDLVRDGNNDPVRCINHD